MSALCRNGTDDQIVDPVRKFAPPHYRFGNFVAVTFVVLFLHICSVCAEPVTLEEVAAFPSQQVTGVTVSAKGRVFVNFPFWSDDHTISVAEVVQGKPKPFLDEIALLMKNIPRQNSSHRNYIERILRCFHAFIRARCARQDRMDETERLCNHS